MLEAHRQFLATFKFGPEERERVRKKIQAFNLKMIAFLGQHPGSTLAEIAKAMEIPVQVALYCLERLVQAGCVRREYARKEAGSC